MLREIVPPLCLVLALFSLIGAFASLAVERPQPSVELHRARIQGNEEYQQVLERDLQKRRWKRVAFTGSLFSGALILGAAGYLSMRRA